MTGSAKNRNQTMQPPQKSTPKPESESANLETSSASSLPEEIGGFDGVEPTRYGDWEVNGRCSDF